MTPNVKKAKAKRKRGPRTCVRTRARKREVYLSAEEDAIFAGMLQRYGCNASKLVRDWLWRAHAQYERRHNRPSEPPPVDPRQMSIEDAAAAS
jgi:hypothetical protein